MLRARELIATAALLAALGAFVYADVATNTTDIDKPTSWPVSAFTKTAPMITSAPGPRAGVVNQTVGATTADAESFTTPKAIKLGAIAVIANGANFSADATGSLSIHLYEAKAGLDANSGGYQPATALGPDLLGGGKGLTFQFNGGAAGRVLEFDFSGADQIDLAGNQLYVVEFWNTTTGNNSLYLARTAKQTDPGGEVYATAAAAADGQEGSTVGRNRVAGGARNIALAVYAIGEGPATTQSTTQPTTQPATQP